MGDSSGGMPKSASVMNEKDMSGSYEGAFMPPVAKFEAAKAKKPKAWQDDRPVSWAWLPAVVGLKVQLYPVKTRLNLDLPEISLPNKRIFWTGKKKEIV